MQSKGKFQSSQTLNKELSLKKPELGPKLHIYNIEQDQNKAIFSGGVEQMICMPSGRVLETLCCMYQFHIAGKISTDQACSSLMEQIKQNTKLENGVELLCHFNAEVATQLNMREVALTWLQLADVKKQFTEILSQPLLAKQVPRDAESKQVQHY